jgi:hypothetical protein
MMLRLWAAALGCADAGATPYALELHRFSQQAFAQVSEDAWTSATATLRDLWSHPDRSTAAQDDIAREGVWDPAEKALNEVWNQLISS